MNKTNNKAKGLVKVGFGGFTQAKAYFNAKNLEPEQELSGVYSGSWKSPYGKQNYNLTLAEELPMGSLVMSNGEDNPAIPAESVVCLNGSGSLDKQMSKVKVGAFVTIKYTGMSTVKNGKFKGAQAHCFDVFTSPENIVETQEAPKAAPRPRQTQAYTETPEWDEP